MGPVVQSIVSLTKSLVRDLLNLSSFHIIKYTHIFLLKKCEELLHKSS